MFKFKSGALPFGFPSGGWSIDRQLGPFFFVAAKICPLAKQGQRTLTGVAKLGRNRDKQVGSIRWATFFESGHNQHPPEPIRHQRRAAILAPPTIQSILPGQLRGWAVGRANMCDDSS